MLGVYLWMTLKYNFEVLSDIYILFENPLALAGLLTLPLDVTCRSCYFSTSWGIPLVFLQHSASDWLASIVV